jgi:hypothetical protein
LSITNNNCFPLYEIALKFNLSEFAKQIYDYIGENINYSNFNFKDKVLSDSSEFKKMLLKNYFCSHSNKMQVNCSGFNFMESSQILDNEKINEVKEICKNNKIVLCLNCKKII